MPILSIQSHVAYGHVGNSAAVFPLQRLGFEVWPVHTLQFSNHAGYPEVGGEIFSARHVRQVIDGIARRGVLDTCQAVLSGYLGSAELGEVVLQTLAQVRAASPKSLYLCDPVIGDRERGRYVKRGLAELLRARLVPAATIVTPNGFELEHLTGAEVRTSRDGLAAARRLLDSGPEIVVVTGLEDPAARPGQIETLAVTAEAAWRVATPRLDLEPMPHGTGDAFSALFLGRMLKGAEVPEALSDATATVFAFFAATRRSGAGELELIAAQDEIVAPSRTFPVERLA
jgi:pyridoxine kinase